MFDLCENKHIGQLVVKYTHNVGSNPIITAGADILACQCQ